MPSSFTKAGLHFQSIDTVPYRGLQKFVRNPEVKRRRYRLLTRLLDRRSILALENKALTVLRNLLRTYGLELWSSAKHSDYYCHSKHYSHKFYAIWTDTPNYVSNRTIHFYLKVPFIQDLISTRCKKVHSRLSAYPNPLIDQLSYLTLHDNPNRWFSWARPSF